MADQGQGNLKKSPESGRLPKGGKDEPQKYGKLQKRLTYLDECPCDNQNCNGFIVRYVDTDEVCEEQTFSIRRNGIALLENYKDRRLALEELQDLLQVYIFIAINNPDQQEEALTSFEDINASLPIILKGVIELRQQVVATGFISFYTEIDEESEQASENFVVERCPLIVKIIGKMRDAEKLDSTEVDDDPAKQLEDEIPEDFLDSFDWNDLFNQKLSGDAPED